ncbi:MAG TPA: TetR/AcrR family transcriptional regulator [Plantibacter sp.]|uniref:TetR/AcrR family transcriptional regulator n=1 Tax=unclassified Plantibacter TaxID=2624265 RepID=UPI002B826FB0|nr:TetR/AcrR family transcriptional regulator [Plantibacter sp.]
MSRSTTAYHHGNLGPALEDAALELMRAQGHATLSLREVARMAGVSHNAPYHHFGDRTALLKRLSERSMEELFVAMRDARAATAQPETPRAVAVRVGVAYVGYAAHHPERFRVIYDPEVCIPGSPTPTMAPLLAAVEGILAQTTASLLPPDRPDLLGPSTIAIWAAVHGLAELVVAGHIGEADVEPALLALLPPG